MGMWATALGSESLKFTAMRVLPVSSF